MPFERAATLAWLRTTPEVPVLIVGGGINGAGVLRELAVNGIDALLVDKGDFAAGATGASSRMIHGGLRYLEHGEFRLVRESLHERNRLLRAAPHCVFPLPTVIPLFSRWAGIGRALRKFLRLGGRPGRRGALLVRIGLALYAYYAGRDDRLPRRSFASGVDARRARPALAPGVIGTATYHDAWNPLPERLCIEVLDDATRAHPTARAVNYLTLVSTDQTRVTLRDEMTGELFQVIPRAVVNATGAWIDIANRSLGATTTHIGGTKGSHLVVDHPELFALTQGAEIFYENDDGRICLILPLHGRVLVGTTDIRVYDPESARCTDEEFAYLVAAVREVFPSIEIKAEHVLARICGVRPLPTSSVGSDRHARTPGEISRDHACRLQPADANRTFPVYALVGGKWTTFRAFAEQVVDQILVHLNQPRRTTTRDAAIGGGRRFPDTPGEQERWTHIVADWTGCDRAMVADLLRRYGTTAEAIAAHHQILGSGAEVPVGGCWTGELDYLCRHEAVQHLDDLVVRRTTLALFGRMDHAQLQRCGEIAAQALGWGPTRTIAEVNRADTLLRERHGVQL